MLETLWKKYLFRERLSFWGLLSIPLAFCSLCYRFGLFVHTMFVKSPTKVPIPVISIGNITVGGTGKTPMVAFLGRMFLDDGLRVGIVSSGYGRPDTTDFIEPGYRVQKMSVDLTGDEVKQLAHELPQAIFSICMSKVEAAKKFEGENVVDVILVDDGFQHRALTRDIDIVTYDAAVPEQQMKLLPRGRMREPLDTIRRADIIAITRSNYSKDITILHEHLHKQAPNAVFYRAQFLADELVNDNERRPVKYLEDKSVFVFAGIGNFQPFQKQVASLSGKIDCAIEFSDHQQYTTDVLARLVQEVRSYDSDVIITTAKDWAKVRGFDFGRDIYYLAQSVDLDPGEEKMIARLKHELGLASVES